MPHRKDNKPGGIFFLLILLASLFSESGQLQISPDGVETKHNKLDGSLD